MTLTCHLSKNKNWNRWKVEDPIFPRIDSTPSGLVNLSQSRLSLHAMNLRQRRAAWTMGSSKEEKTLPITVNSSSTSERRRKRPIKRKATSVCFQVFLIVVFVSTALIIWSRSSSIFSKYTLKRKIKSTSWKVFQCQDGTEGLLDDDYCDCSDGSDEPNTSACSNVLVQKESFRCKNGLQSIHASRVGDGVVDCSDKSDEN